MVVAYVLITVDVGKERDIFDKLKESSGVVEINELYGEWDILAKIKVDKFEELDKVLTEKIRSIEGIKDTSTMLVADYVR
ncbi:MAG: Lrp/AsnC ligand binding domain-containing protein [archaeon]